MKKASPDKKSIPNVLNVLKNDQKLMCEKGLCLIKTTNLKKLDNVINN